MIPETSSRQPVDVYTFPFRARVFVSPGRAPGPQELMTHQTQATRATNRERFRPSYTYSRRSSLSYICLTRVRQPPRATPRSWAPSALRKTPRRLVAFVLHLSSAVSYAGDVMRPPRR
jgi:hypothetical protein